jgi:hypothetical protein
MSLHFALN